MGHEYQDACSLEMATRVATGLAAHPEWLALARSNIARWKERNADAHSLIRCYDEWAAILDRPVPDICAILTARTDEGQRLRQNSPFPGVIPYDEVREIKRRIREEMTRAAGPDHR
jgi:hypothetical protein